MTRVLSSVVVAVLLCGLITSAAQAQQLGRPRGNNVISCQTEGIHVSSTAGTLLHVTGRLRVGNNSHIYRYHFYAEIRFWTTIQAKRVWWQGWLDAFNFREFHVNLDIRGASANAVVHWRPRCYPTNP